MPLVQPRSLIHRWKTSGFPREKSSFLSIYSSERPNAQNTQSLNAVYPDAPSLTQVFGTFSTRVYGRPRRAFTIAVVPRPTNPYPFLLGLGHTTRNLLRN